MVYKKSYLAQWRCSKLPGFIPLCFLFKDNQRLPRKHKEGRLTLLFQSIHVSGNPQWSQLSLRALPLAASTAPALQTSLGPQEVSGSQQTQSGADKWLIFLAMPILVRDQGLNLGTQQWVWSPNHWTTREFPQVTLIMVIKGGQNLMLQMGPRC